LISKFVVFLFMQGEEFPMILECCDSANNLLFNMRQERNFGCEAV
jgi:hypothetical protein